MSSIETLYFVFLTTGFTVGFGHCIGMCGPIVVSLSLNLKGKGALVPLLFYNGGRITTYSLVGGLMGLTGSFTAVTARIAGLQKAVMILAGIVIILMGLAMTGWLPLGRIFADDQSPDTIFSRGFRKLSAAKSLTAYYPLGLLLGLLPCGPVYTALIASSRAGMEATNLFDSFVRGMGVMLAFGVGTIPSLLLVGKLADLGWVKSRELIYKIGAFVMVALGIYFVYRGIKY